MKHSHTWTPLPGAAALLFLGTVALGGNALAAGDPAKAQALATTVCAACHGADGNSVLTANPKLAGQHAEYIRRQLAAFKANERKAAAMNGVAAALSDDDMRNLAAYFAGQKPSAGTAHDAELVVQGQKLYRGGNAEKGVPACAGCHSPDGAGIPVQYPRLAGQHTEYTLNQLKAFRAGERASGLSGMMKTIASRLDDHQMAALAEYIAGLR